MGTCRLWTRGARRRPLCLALACVVAAGIVSGCGGSSGSTGAVNGALIGVTERDFHIATTTSQVAAGAVTLRIHNAGPDEHELIVAPWRNAGPPLRSDGFTINEERIQSSEPGSITPQQPGGTEFLTVRLRPGTYVLFCNMEGHYMAGMHTTLVVH